MKKSTLTVLAVVLIIIAGVVFALVHNSSTPTPAASSSNGSTNNSSSASTTANSIGIANMMFTPSQITVKKGEAVTWTNNDSVTHTVVDDLSNVGGPASGDIAPGATYSFTFNKTGSFQYHCSIHPSMRGTIVVQ